MISLIESMIGETIPLELRWIVILISVCFVFVLIIEVLKILTMFWKR